MKKSEIINQLLEEEDNDLKAMGLFKKKLRAERNERFEEEWLPKLLEVCSCEYHEQSNKYILDTVDGVVDFYPKANKILIRKSNKWIQPGLKWIVTNIINKNVK